MLAHHDQQTELVFGRQACQRVLSLELGCIPILFVPIDAQLLLFRPYRALALLADARSLGYALLVYLLSLGQKGLLICDLVAQHDCFLVSFDDFKFANEHLSMLSNGLFEHFL